MRIERTPGESRRRIPEMGLTLLVVAGLVHLAVRFTYDGFLPPPFIFDTNDTFMDWFNTAFWAHNPGAFDNWRTVYPPLSFVFLRIFGMPGCYDASSFVGRDCDWVGVTAILCWYVLGSALAALAFWRADARTAPFRSVCFIFGLPWLFTLERGNLILPCFVFFTLAHGNIVRSPVIRALAAAVTINFKPYLVVPTMAWALKRQWRVLELAGLLTLFVYLVTFAAFGDGTPMQLYANTVNWAQYVSGYVYEFLFYSTSYAPVLDLDSYKFPTRDFVGSKFLEQLVFWIPVVLHMSQALALLVFVGAWLQPRALPTSRVALLVLTIYLMNQNPGGYTESFVVFLLFLERWERAGPMIAITMGYLLCVSYDYGLGNFAVLHNTSWLGGQPVTTPVGMAAGMFLRPGFIVILFWGLALDSLLLIARAHRGQRPTLAVSLMQVPA